MVTLSPGEFIVVNKHLLEDLVNLGLWDEEMKQELMRANGKTLSHRNSLTILNQRLANIKRKRTKKLGA